MDEKAKSANSKDNGSHLTNDAQQRKLDELPHLRSQMHHANQVTARSFVCLILLFSVTACKGGADGKPPPHDPNQKLSIPRDQNGKVNPYFYLDTSPSLFGVDKDGNGVRDDIDRVIRDWSPTPDFIKPYEQVSRAAAQIMAYSGNDKSEANRLIEVRLTAGDCLVGTYMKFNVDPKSDLMYLNFESLLMNTKNRLGAYKRVFGLARTVVYQAKWEAACEK